MKNILFVASECMPFVKTGGLADVVGSLPKCIDRKYFDCRVIMPMYSFMNQKWKDMLEYKTHFYMDFNWNSYYVGVMEVEYEGVYQKQRNASKTSVFSSFCDICVLFPGWSQYGSSPWRFCNRLRAWSDKYSTS